MLGTHQEFGFLGGASGSRVVGEWGYNGLKPLEDCEDYSVW